MTTDPAALVSEARNFERIADELKSEILRLEQVVTELDAHWQGTAAQAAKAAIARYHEAAQAQVQQLNEITSNLHAAAAQYTATDDERSGAIAAAMSSAMGGPTGSNGQGSAPAQQNGQVHPATTTNAANGHRSGVQLAGFGAKQDGGAAPMPGYVDPFNPRSTQAPGQIGPFPVSPQVAAAAPQRSPQPVPTPPAPGPSGPPKQDFGQCVGQEFKDNIGESMVEKGFEKGLEGAAAGALFGVAITPEIGGVAGIPGAVAGFIGGFAKGLLFDAPIETAGKAAWNCIE